VRLHFLSLCVLAACADSEPGADPGSGPAGASPSGSGLSIVGPTALEGAACLPVRATYTATGAAPLRWSLEGGGAVGVRGESPREGVFELRAVTAADGQGRSGRVVLQVEDAEGRVGLRALQVRRLGAPHWLVLERAGGFDFLDVCEVFPAVRLDPGGPVVARSAGSGWLAYLADVGAGRRAFRVELAALSPQAEALELDASRAHRIRPVGTEGWVGLETETELILGRPGAETVRRPLGGRRHIRVGPGDAPRIVLLDGMTDGLLVEPERRRDTELLGVRDAAFGDEESLFLEGVPGLGRIDLSSREQVFFQRATLAASSPGGRWIVEAPSAAPLRFVPGLEEGETLEVEAFGGRPQVAWSSSQRFGAVRVAADRWASLLEVQGSLRRLDFETDFASTATVTVARQGPVLAFVADDQVSVIFRELDQVEVKNLPLFDALRLSPSGALAVGESQGVDRMVDTRTGETVLRGLGLAEVEAQTWSATEEVLIRVGRDGANQALTWVGRFDLGQEPRTRRYDGRPLSLGDDAVLR